VCRDLTRRMDTRSAWKRKAESSAYYPQAVTPQELEEQADTLELINTELAARLERQSDSDGKIDTKALALAGYAVAAASFLATQHPQVVLASLAFVFDACAAGLATCAYALGAYRDVPAPRALFTRYAGQSKPATLAALAAERVRAFESNHQKHERKTRFWRASLVSLAIAVTLMVASVVVQTGQHGTTAKPGRSGSQPTASFTSSSAGGG
jgi:FlaG/FlaF family flagellin (archaellin)